MICGTVHYLEPVNPQPTCSRPVPYAENAARHAADRDTDAALSKRIARLRLTVFLVGATGVLWMISRGVTPVPLALCLHALCRLRRPRGLARARRCACGVVRCAAPRESSRDVAPRSRLARAAGRGCARDCGPGRSSVCSRPRSFRPRLALSVARASCDAARADDARGLVVAAVVPRRDRRTPGRDVRACGGRRLAAPARSPWCPRRRRAAGRDRSFPHVGGRPGRLRPACRPLAHRRVYPRRNSLDPDRAACHGHDVGGPVAHPARRRDRSVVCDRGAFTERIRSRWRGTGCTRAICRDLRAWSNRTA